MQNIRKSEATPHTRNWNIEFNQKGNYLSTEIYVWN